MSEFQLYVSGENMKKKYLFLLIFVIVSSVFFSVMFTCSQQIFDRLAESETKELFQNINKSKIDENLQKNIAFIEGSYRWKQINSKFNTIWLVYLLFSYIYLFLSYEGTKSVAFRLITILIAVCIVVALKIYAEYIEIEHFEFLDLVLIISCFIVSSLIMYELIHWIVRRIFGFEFVIVGRFEIFKQPENGILTIITFVLASIFSVLLMKQIF